MSSSGFPSAASAYPLLLLVGIVVSFFTWTRFARRDERLLVIYGAALVCAFLGAKVVYLAAEGWMFVHAPQRWLIWATGKTVLGALLGGYGGVEIAKKMTGHIAPTGDLFAIIAPLGIIFGRVGCLLQGCCLGAECTLRWWTLRDRFGVDRWPAVPAEIAFNFTAICLALWLRRRALFPGQHFHFYLIGYGAFRFAHEFARATPRVGWGLSGYHFAALAVLLLGIAGFLCRRGETARVS